MDTNILNKSNGNYGSKSTIADIHNSLEGLNSRIEFSEEIISTLEDWKIQILQSKDQRVKWRKMNSFIEKCGTP